MYKTEKLLTADETFVQSAFIIAKGVMLLSPNIRDQLMTSLELRISNYQSDVTSQLKSVLENVRNFFHRKESQKNWWDILSSNEVVTSLSNNSVERTNSELKSYKCDKRRTTDIGICYSSYEWMITKLGFQNNLPLLENINITLAHG